MEEVEEVEGREETARGKGEISEKFPFPAPLSLQDFCLGVRIWRRSLISRGVLVGGGGNVGGNDAAGHCQLFCTGTQSLWVGIGRERCVSIPEGHAWWRTCLPDGASVQNPYQRRRQ